MPLELYGLCSIVGKIETINAVLGSDKELWLRIRVEVLGTQDISLSGPNLHLWSYFCCSSHKTLTGCQTSQSPPFVVDTHDTLALHIQFLLPEVHVSLGKFKDLAFKFQLESCPSGNLP